MSTTTTESKLQHSFSLFQINFPYTRMFRYDNMLVYSPRGDISNVVQQAKDLITKMDLSLSVETSTLLNNNTVIITDKKINK